MRVVGTSFVRACRADCTAQGVAWQMYSISSILVVSAATPARPFCRGNFGTLTTGCARMLYSMQGRTSAEGDLMRSFLKGSGRTFDHASREGGRPAPATPLYAVTAHTLDGAWP